MRLPQRRNLLLKARNYFWLFTIMCPDILENMYFKNTKIYISAYHESGTDTLVKTMSVSFGQFINSSNLSFCFNAVL